MCLGVPCIELERILTRLNAVLEAILLEEAQCRVRVKNIQDLVSLFLLLVCERFFLLLGHVLENGDATRVEPLRIAVLLEHADQLAAHLTDLVIEDEFLLQRSLCFTLGVAFDVNQVDSDVNSGTDAVLHPLTVLLRPLQIHVDLVVDASVSAFFNPDERDLTSLHGLEARLKVLEGAFIVHDEIVSDFALLVQIDKLTIVKSGLMLVLHRVGVLGK